MVWGLREVSCGVLSGLAVDFFDFEEADRIDCEIGEMEGRIVDRVRDIGDDIDRMGSVARRTWPGAMMTDLCPAISRNEGETVRVV